MREPRRSAELDPEAPQQRVRRSQKTRPAPEKAAVPDLGELEVEQFKSRADTIAASVNGFMQGKADLVELALICLLAEGHLLIEDVPGVGKTSLARSLAGALGTPWQRIQFTPDLLPGDVTGVSVFHQDTSTFVFHQGPVFANVVLADEVNRASPRTQSALLEVMEEGQVTVDGVANPVPRPFLVIATQNPIEMDGTYPLPEAQLDRFLVKTGVGYPDHEAEVRVLQGEHHGDSVDEVAQVSTAVEIGRLVEQAHRVFVAESVFDYIVRLTAATRTHSSLRLGASPRGALGLLRAGRVRAALKGRTYVVPSDIQELALPVLSHRVLMSASYEAAGGSAEAAIAEVVGQVPAPPLGY
jgi:MoxR-like ATPase